MNIKQFEEWITDAILEVPRPLREKIENLAFVVEDEFRTASTKEKVIKLKGNLLGLYQGVPLTARGLRYGSVLPDKITIFKKPIEKIAGPQKENLRKLIREIVHHEIGHYFGMNEVQIRAWEKKRNKK